MQDRNLKPCPFCGGNAYFHRYSLKAKRIAAQHNQPIVPMIVCESCGAAVSFNNPDSSVHDVAAARYWNIRAERTCRNVSYYSPGGDEFKCSECGCRLALDDGYGSTIVLADEKDDYPNRPNYCPSCGAKAV